MKTKTIAFVVYIMCNFCFTSTTFGNPPTPFGQWQASNGTITSECPIGFSCAVIIEESGYLQRQLIDETTRDNFVQSISLDFGATGNSSSLPSSGESFIKRNFGRDQSPADIGLANKQQIFESGVNPVDGSIANFDLSTTIATGWADDSINPSVSTQQSIEETSQAASVFSSYFTFDANYNADGNTTGYKTIIEQEFTQPLGVDQPLDIKDSDDCKDNNVCNVNVIDAQGFVQREISGDFLTQGGQVQLPDGRAVNWIAGDTVKVTWIGQRFNHTQKLEEFEPGKFLPGFELLETGFTVYDNKSDNQGPIRYFAYRDSSPINWNENTFGKTPTLSQAASGITKPPLKDEDKSTPVSTSIVVTDRPYQVDSSPGLAAIDIPSPVSFGSWNATSGMISASCPDNFNCSAPIKDNGILQRTITNIATNENYIQTILTDRFATGSSEAVAFNNENLIKINQDEHADFGILSKQVISDISEGALNSRSVIRTGWAQHPDTPDITIEQHLNAKIDAQFFNFSSDFLYSLNNDSSGTATGFKMDMEQVMYGSTNLNPYYVNANRNDVLMFVRRERAGNELLTSGVASSNDKDNQFECKADDKDCIRWLAGEDVTVTWIGQIFDWELEKQDEDFARFAYQSYDNIVDNFEPTFYSTFEDGPGPISWVEQIFGARPVFPIAIEQKD